jgi:hypothetical protein
MSGTVHRPYLPKRSIEELTERLKQIEVELGEKLDQVRSDWAVDALEMEEITLSPRKSEIGIELVALAWAPEGDREEEER